MAYGQGHGHGQGQGQGQGHGHIETIRLSDVVVGTLDDTLSDID